MGEASSIPAKQGYRFGTFKGVYTPSVLTVLGVVMYLRLGWVLGQVGILETVLIVTLASSITFLTSLSLSALATNMRVGGGGAYYIISRSLGLEAGAAIGLPLFLAQALGIAFYIAGFAESVVAVYPGLDPKLVGMVTLTVLAALAYLSADLALRAQFLIMAAIFVSLVSFFTGAMPAQPEVIAPSAWPPLFKFWGVFAVFFPAVTGIEAGLAMSGDLKNPARALPLGTIAAVLTGFVVYLAIPLFLWHLGVDRGVLLTDPVILQRVARWGPLVIAGIWAASLSSALGALLGAPRTLQALAHDHVVPHIVGRGYGRGGDPRIATAVSFAIGALGIWLGDLNMIAPVLSMFFLTSYGLLNLCAGFGGLIAGPTWRPQFKVPLGLSIAGFAACVGTMLMINAGATMIALVVTGAVYYFVKRRSLISRWGDMRYGIMMFIARNLLYTLARRPGDERSWKPNILALSGSPTQRWYLVALANAIARRRSFLTVATGVPKSAWSADRVKSLRASITAFLDRNNVQAFVKIFPAEDPLTEARNLIRLYGFGPLAPNTILVGETERTENYVEFARLIELVAGMRRNLIIVREAAEGTEAPDDKPGQDRRIDLWWRGKSHNASFMLAVVYLLKQSPEWLHAKLALKMIVDSETARVDVQDGLVRFARQERINAEPEVVVRNGRDAFSIIRESSNDADLVLIGLRPPEPGETPQAYSNYYHELLLQTHELPVTAMVMAAEEVDFQRIFDSGLAEDD